MKKIFNILLLLFITVVLTGCVKPKVNKNNVTFFIPEEFKSYMPYEKLPEFSLEVTKPVNSHPQEKSFTKILMQNDDYYISDLISKTINKYKDLNRVHIELVEKNNSKRAQINYRDGFGKVRKDYLLTDDGFAYYEVAYLDLESGLKLTIDYRRFKHGGQEYFVWRETSGLNMTLYYPLMVTKINGEFKILLLTLPPLVKFQVSPLLRVKRILNDEYLKSGHYTFLVKSNKEEVIKYYKQFGYDETSETFNYLGYNFKLEFLEQEIKGKKMLYFQIKHVI